MFETVASVAHLQVHDFTAAVPEDRATPEVRASLMQSFSMFVQRVPCACLQARELAMNMSQRYIISVTDLCRFFCSPHIDLKAENNREFARNLKEHSVLYRVLQYVLL